MSEHRKEGAIAVWDTYNGQPYPLVILKGTEWVELTLADVLAEVKAAVGTAPVPSFPMPGLR